MSKSAKKTIDFLEAVEEQLVRPRVTLAKTPAPVPPAPVPPAPVKLPTVIRKAPVRLFNTPDVGDTKIRKYSGVEQAVQLAETADSALSNTAFALDTSKAATAAARKAAPTAATKAATAISSLASKAPKTAAAVTRVVPAVSAAGRLSAPIQLALASTDAVRDLTDPEYRTEAKESMKAAFEKAESKPKLAMVDAVSSALARPVSTARGMLGAVSDAQTEAINARLLQDTLRRRKYKPQAPEEIPAVDIKKGNPQRQLDQARKYFK